MSTNINDKLVSTICDNLSDEKIIPYLKDLLHLSSKSVYRRVNGESPFTFQESIAICADLNISLDKIINQNKAQRAYFDIDTAAFSGSEQAYASTLKQHINILKQAYNAKEKNLTWNNNTLLPVTCIGYETLFKFLFYKYKRQIDKVAFNFSFSDVIVPAEITNLCKEGKFYHNNLTKYSTYICDDRMFYNIVKDILYYWDMMLISKSELSQLKNSLNDMLDELTKAITDDTRDKHSEIIFYYSSLPLITNSIYYNFDETQISQIWMYPVNPIVVYDSDFCNMHHRLLNISKKYATLVTFSNEVYQSHFLMKQRGYINSIP